MLETSGPLGSRPNAPLPYFGKVNSGQNFSLCMGFVLLLPRKTAAIFLGWESPAMSSSEKGIATGQGKETTFFFFFFLGGREVSWRRMGRVPKQTNSRAPGCGSTSLLAEWRGDAEPSPCLAQFCPPRCPIPSPAPHLAGKLGVTPHQGHKHPRVLQPAPSPPAQRHCQPALAVRPSKLSFCRVLPLF